MTDEIYDLGFTATPNSPDPNELGVFLFTLLIGSALVLYGAVLVTLGGFQ